MNKQEETLRRFKEENYDLAIDPDVSHIEATEDGDVFVHMQGYAYPLIFKDFGRE